MTIITQKILDIVLDLNYFSFSNIKPNPMYLPKHQTLSPNHHFSQPIWYVEYYYVHAHMTWSQKFCKSEISLDTGCIYVSNIVKRKATTLRHERRVAYLNYWNLESEPFSLR